MTHSCLTAIHWVCMPACQFVCLGASLSCLPILFLLILRGLWANQTRTHTERLVTLLVAVIYNLSLYLPSEERIQRLYFFSNNPVISYLAWFFST